jgi:hypothetical protein
MDLRHDLLSRCVATLLCSSVAIGSALAGPADDAAYLAYLKDFKSGAALAAAQRTGVSPVTIGLRLRQLYTKTSFYKPYADPAQTANGEARQHLTAGRFAECLTAAQTAQELNYTSLDAHFFAGQCSARLGDPEQAKRYVTPYALLLGSIIKEPGRDGKSPDTSYRVINIPEQYVVLSHLAFKRGSKTLVPDKTGQMNDCHHQTAADSGGEAMMCFNVEAPLASLRRDRQPEPAPKTPKTP